jgi:hypothetical protein
MDPLELLPAEIVLRIIDFSPISTVAALTRVTRSWHSFIEEAHQEAIYSSHSKTFCPNTRRDLSFLTETRSFAKYFEDTTSWKDLCSRQTLLYRNWNEKEPLTRESIFQVGNDAVWRFRVDWKRRLIISTSQQGGFNVTDLDTGNLLWRLGNDQVRPFAHLEYENGVAVFDCANNGLEVWKSSSGSLRRGTFERTAILPHDCIVRGFQLSYKTLCVVSTQGQGFVYDMSLNTPRLKTHLEIEEDATGHLYQDSEVVMYCMGRKGYHIHSKQSGAFLGVLDPAKCQKFYYIVHPDEPRYSIVSTGSSFSSLPSVEVFPPRDPTRDRLSPIDIRDGRFEETTDRTRIKLESDEWGAGILSGSMMVGISRGGRMFVLSDWREAIQNPKTIASNSNIIECDANESSYHINFGGWLSVQDNRALFEVRDRVYVISLDRNSVGQGHGSQEIRPSYCFTTSSATQLAVPVSFMAIYDDCIMSTYTVRIIALLHIETRKGANLN